MSNPTNDKPHAISDITLICGCGHSGTSLLANMLASHSNVYIPLRETEAFLNESTATQKLNELQCEFSASGKSVLVEKTPSHVNKIQLIEKMIVRPKFIFMTRDGRDVAASYIKRTGNATDGYQRWIRENSIIATLLDKKNTLLVRYEDVISKTRDQLMRICSFIGITYESEMLDYHRTPRLWFNTEEIKRGTGADGEEHVNLRNWQINQPIFDDRGKWHTLLTDSDKLLFSTPEAQRLLKIFNYI